MSTKYGKTPEQWRENVAIATGALRAIAAARATTTYKVLAEMIGPDVAYRHELARILGEIAATEHEAGRPLLTAVVVSLTNRTPGIGFAGIARDLGIEIPEGQEMNFWIEELLRCWSHWGNH